MEQTSFKDFNKYIAQTSPDPIGLPVQSAQGCYIYDEKGNAYLDLIAGVTVCNLGHQHPAITKAVQQQLKRYTHTMVYGEHIQSPQVRFARALAQHLPDPLQQTYFTSSGSEAIEGALKLAKRYTGKQEIISFYNGYHGSTHGAMSLSGDDKYRSAFQPLLPHIHFLPFNDKTTLKKITDGTAAVVVEPIQGEAGVQRPDSSFLPQLKERCRNTDTLLIFDECQTGFGRTGPLFAFEHYNTVPDILVTAKAMGGGFPLGGIISSPALMKTFQDNPPLGHLTTFGGHPLACTAGQAQLKTLYEKSILSEVSLKGKLFNQHLRHPAIQEIRYKGLLFAIVFEKDTPVRTIAKRCMQKGALVHWFLFAQHCLRLAPPLTISKKEIKKGCSIIQEAIEEVLS